LNLLVIAIVKSAISDSLQGLEIMPVRILLVAFKNGQGSNEVSFLQEVSHIWQLVLLLLYGY
jgi:hypothetical protein